MEQSAETREKVIQQEPMGGFSDSSGSEAEDYARAHFLLPKRTGAPRIGRRTII